MGFNDSSQPANTSQDGCGDNDCSHMNGSCDLIALFSSDDQYSTNDIGKWNGDTTNAVDFVLHDGSQVGDEKSMSLTNPGDPNSWIPTDFRNSNPPVATPGYATPGYEDNFIIEGVLGDIYPDNEINVLDVVTLVSIILGNYDATEEQQYLADINQDGNIDVNDVVALIDMLLYGDLELTNSEQQQLQNALNKLQYNLTTKPNRIQTITQCNDPNAFNYNPDGRGCSDYEYDYGCCEYYIGNMR